MYKNDSDIYLEIIQVINRRLEAEGLDGLWQVIQEGMPGAAPDFSHIFINKTGSRRIGLQMHRSKWDISEAKMRREEEYYQSVVLSLRFAISPAAADGGTSADTANRIMTYFNSEQGIEDMRKLGYEVDPLEILEEDGSDPHSKEASFDLVVTIDQLVESETPSADKFNVNLNAI